MNTMTAHEGKMWNLIGALGWVESGYDYEGIENLLQQQDDDTIHSLREFVGERINDLSERVESFEQHNDERCGNYGGDDSWHDMLCHVVGMGKFTFDTIMNSPRRLNGVDYKENFLYAIPHDTEYTRLGRTLDFHQEQAANCLQSLVHDYKDDLSPRDINAIEMLARRMRALLEGDIVTACEGLTGRRDDPARRELYNSMCNWPANHRMAMYANTLQDAARKLIH